MPIKNSLLDEHLDELLDERHPLFSLLSDPMQLGLIIGAILGAFWVARKASKPRSATRRPISAGAIALGDTLS